MAKIGILNRTALKGISRPVYTLDQGEEFVVKSGIRRFIIRGTRDSLQIFGRDYASEGAEDIFAGTINGIVVGVSFSVGYDKDIVVKDIKILEV